MKQLEKLFKTKYEIFNGVVVTDDLDMGAIRQNYDLEETVIQAVNAGNDILLFSNRERHNPNLADDINKIIKNAIFRWTY